ncbi:unnamed protein product [Rotaria sp. Silwood2]|nr:unnamed protein product [Rotaria sp. Silwood2]CAF4017640.1 unnamed protein product [Rotaria sp. Silwood2]
MRYAKVAEDFGLLSMSTSITNPALKGELILIIANLFGVNDNAVKALEHICPKQIDLIRKNHRRLCNLLVDIDEWK